MEDEVKKTPENDHSVAYMRGFNDALRKAEGEARDYGRNVPAGRMFADRIAIFIRDIQP